MNVSWRPQARTALRKILTHIREQNPDAAVALQRTIESATERLPNHPYAFRIGRVAATRELVVHPNYIIVYQVGDAVTIVAVLHSRRAYP